MLDFFDSDLILIERLAAGGMGEVYRAVQFGLGGFEKTVAVKRILPINISNSEFKDMFLRETAICAGLQHPNIVQVFRNGIFEDYLYLVMEYIHGKNVDQIIGAANAVGKTIPIPMSCFIISESAKGLEYAHSLKNPRTGEDLHLVHRDISPPNIMVSYGGEVKVVDFGIATAANTTRLTKSGTLKGKESYMSPEQVEGHPLDRRSDIFTLGIVLYELLTGRILFEGETTFATLTNIRNCKIDDPRSSNSAIDESLLEILMKCLRADPQARYQTAGELYRELAVYLNQKFPEFVAGDLSVFIQDLFREKFDSETRKIQDDHSKIDRRVIAERSATIAALKERVPPGSSRGSGSRPAVVIPGGPDGSGSRKSQGDSLTTNQGGSKGGIRSVVENGSGRRQNLADNDRLEGEDGPPMHHTTSLIARRQILMILFLGLVNLSLALVLLKHNGRWPFRPAVVANTPTTIAPQPPPNTQTSLPPPNAELKTQEQIPSLIFSIGRTGSKAFPPDLIKDLDSWYDADNVKLESELRIVALKDRGGLNHIAEQADPGRRPRLTLKAINRLPAITFDGGKAYFDADGVADSLRSANGLTLFYVARSRPSAKQQYILSLTGPRVTSDLLRAGFGPEGTARIKFDALSQHYIDSRRLDTMQWTIYTVVFERAYAELFANGKLEISSPITTPINFAESKFLSIGQEWDDSGPSDFLDGDVAELIIFGRALPYQERVGIEKYLSEKFNIVLPEK